MYKKQLDKKANGNFKIYDIINSEINNCAISPEVNPNRQIDQLTEYNMRNIYQRITIDLSTSSPAHLFVIIGRRKQGERFFKISLGTKLKVSPRPFSKKKN